MLTVQVLTSVAQVTDIIAPVKRTKPLHVVADSRGFMLEQFADRLHMLRAQASLDASPDARGGMLLTTDILPTETLSAGTHPQVVAIPPGVSAIIGSSVFWVFC